MNVLTLDTETTIFQKGNPYSKRNKLVAIGLKYNDEPVQTFFGTGGSDLFAWVNGWISKADIIVGFNLKFDLSWLARYNLYDALAFGGRFWDCQLVAFLLARQTTPYPNLNSVAAALGLGTKLNSINSKYWVLDIDTDAIPREELAEYLMRDVDLTYQVYQKQKDLVPKTMERLISLSNQDMPLLHQMETNGLYIDSEGAIAENAATVIQVAALEEELSKLFDVKCPVNFSSHEHLSILLYGGKIEVSQPVQTGFYKTGIKAGQPKYKKVVYAVEYPRLMEPPKGSELKKEGYWETNITSLKAQKLNKKMKKIVDLLIERSKAIKLSSTYYSSLSKMSEEMDWEHNMIHGRFNQCVAVTGRLSSTKPNLQNIPSEMKKFIRSRYV